MNKSTQIEKVVIINSVNDILTVSSTQIAEHFGKQHKDVLRAIENIKAQNSAVTSMLSICKVKRDKETGTNSFPFPTMLIGTRVKIPRKAFIKAMEGE